MKKLIPIIIIFIFFSIGCEKSDEITSAINQATTDKYSKTIATSLDGHIEVTLKYNRPEEYYEAYELYRRSIEEFQQNMDADYLSQFKGNDFDQLSEAELAQFTNDDVGPIISIGDIDNE